jgi:hypothetical protein
VEHGAHLIGRQINICFTIVTLDKTMAIAVAENSALELCEEAGRSAGVLGICFDKKSLLKNVFYAATGLKYAVAIFRDKCGLAKRKAKM